MKSTVSDIILKFFIVVCVAGLCTLYALYNHTYLKPSYQWALSKCSDYNLPSYDSDVTEIVDELRSLGWEFKVTDRPVTNMNGVVSVSDKVVMLWNTSDYVVLHELMHAYGYVTYGDLTEEFADSNALAIMEGRWTK